MKWKRLKNYWHEGNLLLEYRCKQKLYLICNYSIRQRFLILRCLCLYFFGGNDMFNILKKKKTIVAPVSGQVIPLSDVKDEVFSSGMMGDGIAIQPTDDIFVAPVSYTHLLLEVYQCSLVVVYVLLMVESLFYQLLATLWCML